MGGELTCSTKQSDSFPCPKFEGDAVENRRKLFTVSLKQEHQMFSINSQEISTNHNQVLHINK